MAEYERILAAMGAVPLGADPKVILAGDNQEPGYNQIDPLSNLVRTLKARKIEIEAEVKKKQEEVTKKADMYKTLREAGYDPKAAYEAVIKNTITPPGPEDPLKKTPRDKILDKIAKGETLTEGEQKLYDETIKHKPAGSGDLLDEAIGNKDSLDETDNQKKMREKILDKIARGQTLTPGEQKIYDEVIKKGSVKPQENLDVVLGAGNDELVPVVSPTGVKGSIPKSKLAAALKAGYKKR